MIIGKKYLNNSKKIIDFIENNIVLDNYILELLNIKENNILLIPSEYYSIDYQIECKDNMIGDKFNYLDNIGNHKQSIVYLNKLTSDINNLEADINSIRRQINNLRKGKGLKIYNKITIIFEKNIYWDNISTDLLNLLSNRLASPIIFQDTLLTYDIIKTYQNTELKVNIQ
jgi:hypothetical protein